MAHEQILEKIGRNITPQLYEEIRKEWKIHSIAEDNRDLPGLMSTLTDDCIYELPQAGDAWHGKEGATRFYTQLLTAFPDIKFDLQNIVIGPQGVFEEANVTATHQDDWLNYQATGKKIEFKVIILFPWDLEKKKFSGERVYFFGLEEFLKS